MVPRPKIILGLSLLQDSDKFSSSFFVAGFFEISIIQRRGVNIWTGTIITHGRLIRPIIYRAISEVNICKFIIIIDCNWQMCRIHVYSKNNIQIMRSIHNRVSLKIHKLYWILWSQYLSTVYIYIYTIYSEAIIARINNTPQYTVRMCCIEHKCNIYIYNDIGTALTVCEQRIEFLRPLQLHSHWLQSHRADGSQSNRAIQHSERCI